jgi:hypothetical protein
MSPARLKGDWTSWRDKPFAKDAKAEERRQQGEKWSALAEWVRKHNGVVTSTPNNKTLRIEVAKNLSAKLTEELTSLGYAVLPRGSTMRVVGTDTINPAGERFVGVQSPFAECDVLEIRLDGR